MNELQLSTTTKTLLSAAKADVPGAAARAKMWAGVSGAIGTAAGVTGITAGSVVGGGTSVAKLVSLGALFGGTLTVGLAATFLYLGPAPSPHSGNPPPVADHSVVLRDTRPAFATPSAAAPAIAPEQRPETQVVAGPAPIAPPVPVSKHTRTAPHSAKGGGREDALGREASLVTQARVALGRQDPRAALRAVRAARALPSHQLAPEELAVEEQALRALGQSDEANALEVQLRLQYPESDLAR